MGWVGQSLIVTGAAAFGWILARASADPPEDPQLPRYAPPTRPPVQHYGSTAETDRSYDAAQIFDLQAQVRVGQDSISALKARVHSLSVALRAAERGEELMMLRADVRNRESVMVTLNAQLETLRNQARVKENATSVAEAQAARLSVALERTNADVRRLRALSMDTRNSDAIIVSLESQLEALRAQVRSNDTTISTLESEIISLVATLQSLGNVQCDRCTPPASVVTEMARGKWFRRQADTLNEEAGKLFFNAHNPELVGARARLRNEMRIDLHHQFRAAAVEYVTKYATSARDQGFDKLIFIVGRGLHSEDNVPKLRPLVLETLRSMDMEAHSPRSNPGEIIVKLQTRVE
ncbi:unnamed protein product [Peniophora sp. CBMAI 1063]|nr:unnamed protein product [Peniophora sp. CBMAI 1063]